jgi:tetratricopeptide repeat protein 21B
VSVLIANSEISVEMGDIKKALSILRAVNPSSSYYQDSRKLMADIYLNNLKDRRHFA